MDKETSKIIEPFMDNAPTASYYLNMYTVPAGGYHKTEGFNIDIKRDTQRVAPVIVDMRAGGTYRARRKFDSKAFVPPMVRPITNFNIYELMGRQFGKDQHRDPEFMADMAALIMEESETTIKEIMRLDELMCAQGQTEGALTLKDEKGNDAFELDFELKATHFPQVTTSWSDPGADIIGDMRTLAIEIKKDSHRKVTRFTMSPEDFDYCRVNTGFKAYFEPRRIENGQIDRFTELEGGGVIMGTIRMHEIEALIVVNGEQYEDENGDVQRYHPVNKCHARVENARFDIQFGAIPRIVDIDPRLRALANVIPPRFTDDARRLDLQFNMAIDKWGENLDIAFGTRPLAVPTDGDAFGCITTTAP